MQNDKTICYLVTMQIILEEVEYGGPDLTTNFGLVGQKYDLHSDYKANNFGVLHVYDDFPFSLYYLYSGN